ncbi:MAG: DNA replication and repair protein RecF [Bacteroidales bacterium]|nr:DNA replication and repair protein RecF [Bacteroidales bacterium]
MFLKKLQIINFKNYVQSEIEFSEKINCFVGNNGVGKTNLLDAIYYLSFTKSYFNTIDTQNVRHGEEFFAIHGTYHRNGGLPEQVSCIQKSGSKKQFKLNTKEYERMSDHIGLFPCVMVSPYDRDLINEGSDIRRKFIDSVISQFDKTYLDILIRYNRLLEQRNSLLKQFAENRSFDSGMLELMDEQMAQPATHIFEKRTEFLQGFLPIFSYYFRFISGGLEEVDIRYESRLKEGNYLDIVKDATGKDLSARYSTVGIHKDDLLFDIKGYPVKKFGSQGQQKSFAVALKLAQFDFTRNLVNYKPLLLFDDIFDKLDPERVQQIIDLVSRDSFGQVFITDTEPDRIRRSFNSSEISHKVFEIQSSGIQFLY